jgi:hypothetical protein
LGRSAAARPKAGDVSADVTCIKRSFGACINIGSNWQQKEMRMSTERWILGPDDGTVLFEKLMRVLKQFDFIVDPKWDIADLARFPMCSTVGTILVEAETAEGLVVSGDPTVISKLRDRWGAI